MNKLLIATAVALLTVAGSAQAIEYSYGGNTTGAPVYNRALDDFSALSAVGTSVRYQTLVFTVSTSGSYDFRSTATSIPTGGSSVWDNFLFLYSPTFNTATPLLNGLIANDDLTFGSFGLAGFTFGLTAGTTYVLVTTGFDALDFGAYTNTVNGPGTVAVVPEPGTYGLLALGLAAVGAAARRRGQFAERT